MRALLPLLLIVCLLAGCSQEKRQVTDLAKRCTEMSQSLDTAGRSYSAVLTPWLDGEKIDVSALEAALDKLAPLPGQYLAELEKIPVVEDDDVKAYRASMVSYLKVEEEMVKFLQATNKKVAASNPGPETLRTEVLNGLKQVSKTEQAAIREVNVRASDLTSALYR